MADIVKFNSEDQPALEMKEAPHEEKERQQENQQEIEHIQKKAHVQETESQVLQEEKEKAPGNVLDASGHVHTEPQKDASEAHQHEGGNVLPEQSNPHAHVWSNDPNEPFAGQWAPSMTKEPDTYDTKEEQPTANAADHSKQRRHHRLGSQSSDLDRMFESTMTDFKNIFDTSDESFPQQKDHHKLHNPTPLHPIQPDELIWNLQIKAIKYILVASLVCYLVGRLRFGYIMGIIIISLCAWAYWNLGRTSSAGLEWQLEKQENMKTLYTSEGESVEWLNYMLEKIWRSVDPDMFAVVEDLLEDTLQSVSPSFIQNVKVSDFDIGVQAPRIQMIRVFPPLPGQPEESIFGEAAFSFHAHPVASLVTNRSPKATPPGLAIRFQTALKAPFEVKAELTAVSGKIRFKILTCPDLPFISKATIAFTSVPKIETGVMPLSKHLNIMNLPTIKTLVNEGVKLGFADLVDPKSMTIDVKALVGAFAQDTNAIGVVKVEVREASRDASIQLQDMEDSYATLSLSTQPKKSSSSTRVLTNDKNPRWNENLYVLVYKDDIVSETKVDVKVWDADKVKFDDMWGSVSMSVKDIVQGKLDKLGNVSSYCMEERVVFDGWTPIDGKEERKSKVKLNMKMSFHPKYPTPNMEIFSGDAMAKKKKSEEAQKKDENEKSAVLDAPVDAAHTNGILSVQIHQAVDLEIGDPEVLPTDDEFKHPYSPNKVVSPYAILYINDNKVYQTRTKLRNPSPHWNAITEHFIRNYEDASIRISVKTAMDIERDPVLGTKSLHLKDLFIDQEDKFKEVQQWIPLTNGIGFGKILLSVKYKPVKMTLPRELQGADVGTLIVERISFTNLKEPFNDNNINSTKATLALNVDPVIIKRLKAKNISKPQPDGEQENDETKTIERVGPYGWYNQHLYFPIMMRYRTALYVHITQGSISTTKSTGRFWLKEMVDDQWQDIVVGLHPHLNEKTKEANRNEDSWPKEGEFGQVTIRMKLIPGFSPVHTHLRTFNKDFVGADPFYNDALKFKAQKWIKEQNDKKKEKGEDDDDTDEVPFDYDMQAAVQAEKSRQIETEEADRNERRSSSLSSEYGEDEDEDDTDMDDTEFQADMIDQRKKKNISKHRVVRKVAWSLDKVKNKVDVLREGFNSEARASRSVAKEV
ncbi:3-isopropylmalate dehydrogenase [Mucor velutinosus]|uniref:3-isopropylmalate dehydrogenase n=1 Tax=Mucor velutinosus TaxID=708070 RepID=A0AAN7DEW2_9FUNG|nr:3-isopropylmalate dehydrogenase [Mucor velutinosus]